MLDPACLDAFIAIAEERHFVRAADRLGIAQSVASKRLQRLEDQIGARLIDRGGKAEVRLSRSGALFLEEARSALAALEQAERNARRQALGVSGPLRIGYVFSAALSGVLPRLLQTLHDRLPAIEPVLEPLDTPSQIAAIEDGRIDLAFIRPRPSYSEAVVATTVHSEPVVIALASAHPLSRQDRLARADLQGQTFIVPQFHEETGLINAIADLCRRGGFAMPPVISTRDFISAASIAAAGTGVVLAPASLMALTLEGLCFRPLVDDDTRLDLVMLMRRDLGEATTRLLQAFLPHPIKNRQRHPAD